MKMCSTPIIVALDYPNAATALSLVNQLSPELCRLKMGKELFVATGPDLVCQLVAKGFDVFLDLKFHDIPNTVAQACIAAAHLGVWMVNIHTSGGAKMMSAARAAIDQLEGHKPLLIGVTALTSIAEVDLKELGINRSPQEHVLHLAELAYQAGLDGVVCSAEEAEVLRAKFGKAFCLVTPGIRPVDYLTKDDQSRIMTPREALRAGSDYIVIGRPITQASNPLAVLNSIIKSL